MSGDWWARYQPVKKSAAKCRFARAVSLRPSLTRLNFEPEMPSRKAAGACPNRSRAKVSTAAGVTLWLPSAAGIAVSDEEGLRPVPGLAQGHWVALSIRMPSASNSSTCSGICPSACVAQDRQGS